MPETVCVTVEQLREIEWADGSCDSLWCPVCTAQKPEAHAPDCWLGKAIAKADRLKDWKPEVGDRVRLKAMPEGPVFTVLMVGKSIWTQRDKAIVRETEKDRATSRYVAELMPEEGE